MKDSYDILLQRDEWKEKCAIILERDNYTCKHCNCRGIHNDTFLKISDIDDINAFFPGKFVFQGKNIAEFCDSIPWNEEGKDYSVKWDFKTKLFNGAYINIFRPLKVEAFVFASDNKLVNKSFKRYGNGKMDGFYNNVKFNFYIHAFKFNDDLCSTSYASLKYEFRLQFFENLEITISCDNCLYFIKVSFPFVSLSTSHNVQILRIKQFNIHHNYYICGKKPWEYGDDALVTLCSDCHKKFHNTHEVPVYSSSEKKIESYAKLCDRCGGSGFLPQYEYYEDGICFKCNGEGVVF